MTDKIMMTEEFLRQLGSCAPYLTAFRKAFPATNYPDGVEITADVCEAHADAFDWAWAADVMLVQQKYREWTAATSHGNATYDALQREREEASTARERALTDWQTRHDQRFNYPTSGTPAAASREYTQLEREWEKKLEEFNTRSRKHSARSFGVLFEDPENYSQRVKDVATYVERERREREEYDLRTAVNRAEELRQSIDHNTRVIDRTRRALKRDRDALPAAEQAAVQAQGRLAELRLERARQEAQRAEESLRQRQQAVAELEAQIAAAQAATAAAAPTTDAVTSDATSDATSDDATKELANA